MPIIRIDVMGLKEDIRALWERFEAGNEYGIELVGAPQPIDPVIGEYAAGSIEDIPDEENFDALFEDFPRLCVFICVIDGENQNFAFWEGTAGRRTWNETYDLDGGDDWDDDFVRGYREEWLSGMWDRCDDDGETIPPLPSKFWDSAERRAAAVRLGGSALQHVPEALKTAELCLTAVRQYGWALAHVPKALKTAELCIAAVRQNGRTLQHVPKALNTAELCLAAVQQDGYALKDVPESLRTAELCLAAVQQNGYALKDVPEALKTAELCLLAVQQNGNALEFVPEELQKQIKRALNETSDDDDDDYNNSNDDEIIFESEALAFVREDGMALRRVPKELKTEEVCLAAVRQNSDALEFVPDELKAQIERALGKTSGDDETEDSDEADDDYGDTSEAAALAAVWEDPEAFLRIGEEYRTRKVCLAAIKALGGVCEYIPEELQSEEFFLEAVKVNQNGKALKYIPAEYLTQKVCAAALAYHPDALDGSELNGIAKTLYGAKAFDTAILLLSKAIEDDSELASAWGLRGDCHFQKGDYGKAIADFKKTVELDPGVAMGWNFLAYAYFNKKDYAQAFTTASKAIDLKPENAGYWASRAKFYEAAGKYGQAAADCEKALELDPALESARQILERCKKKAAGKK